MPSPWEPIATQVERYEATGGVEGGTMEGAPCVILTTRGNKSGNLRKTPLIRVEHEGTYAVIASMGGAPDHPEWYYNLADGSEVAVQDGADVHDLITREPLCSSAALGFGGPELVQRFGGPMAQEPTAA